MCLNEGSMPIYMPQLNSQVSSMLQWVLYTDNNDANDDKDADANNDDNAA